MATQRKTAAGRKATTTRKQTVPARPARAGGKTASVAKPHARAAVAARPAARADAKPAAAKPAPAKVVGRPAVKGVGGVAKVVGRPAEKGAGLAAKVVGRPAVKGVGGVAKVVGHPAEKGAGLAAQVVGRPAVKGAGPAAKVVGRPAVKGKPKVAVARRAFDTTVRPLGVIPPDRRSAERPPLAVPARTPSAPVRAAKAAPKVSGVQRVTEKDYKEFEELLLLERKKIMKEMGHLETTVLKVNQRESAGDLSRYSFHMADAGTDAMEREKSFLLASAEGRILMEINEALRRLYRSEFGSCEICGQPIGRARLEAMPYTRLCLPCKEKEERASRGAL